MSWNTKRGLLRLGLFLFFQCVTTFVLLLRNIGDNFTGLEGLTNKEHFVKNYHSRDNDDAFLPRILAIVFPQFHQDPLNDLIWGTGFTDWNNLNATPELNRDGIPILRPTELGYYDYALEEPRRKQGLLAKQYGIDGFIFHHYWFYDKSHPGPTLGRPLENMLVDGYPNISFCLHWCSSKWINTWSGAKVNPNFKYPKKNTMQQQFYPDNDEQALEHYNWLRKFFHHPNYIKVNGKPLFMMYEKKPSSIPVLQKFQEFAKKDGFPGLYLTVGLMKPHSHLINKNNVNELEKLERSSQRSGLVKGENMFDKVVTYPKPMGWNHALEIPNWCGKDNATRVDEIAGILSSFDNTPRRSVQDAVIWSPGPPEEVLHAFETNLQAALYYESCCFDDKARKTSDRFLVINAMNEWAEGMALEPSNVYGRKFLEAIRRTKQTLQTSRCHMKDLPK